MQLHSFSKDQVLGWYKPGRAPVVLGSVAVEASGTHEHETAHRQLMETSSLGVLMKYLAIVPSDDRIESEQRRLLFGRLLELCWITHEGLATHQQYCFLRHHISIDSAEEFLSKLPPSYKMAFEKFWLDRINLDVGAVKPFAQSFLQMPSGGRRYDDEFDDRIIELTRKCVALIIARAAKSIPISKLIVQCDGPPDSRIYSSAKSNAPDVRLQKIITALDFGDSNLATEWTIRLLAAEYKAMRDGSYRYFDEIATRIVYEVCKMTELPFERSDEIDEPALLKSLGGEGLFRITDARDLDYQVTQEQMRTSSVAPERYLEPHKIELDPSYFEYNQYISFLGQAPTVICEIGYISDQKCGLIFNCYVDINCPRINRSELDVGHDEKSPFLCARFAIPLGVEALNDPDVVPTIYQSYPHVQWTWLLPVETIQLHPFISEDSNTVLTAFSETRFSKIERSSVRSVDRIGIVADGLGMAQVQHDLAHIDILPSDSCLRTHVLEISDRVRKVSVVAIGTTNDEEPADYRGNALFNAIYHSVPNAHKAQKS